MSTVSASSGPIYSVRIGDTLNIGVRNGSSSSNSSGTSSGTKVVTATQGEATVTAALKQSTEIFKQLSSLQNQIQQAGPNPDAATAKALTANIAKITKQIDQLAANANSGTANLLSNANSSVTVATSSGLKVNIAAQPLDSKSLGLDGLSVSDAASLRAATGKVAQAVGQTQLAVFRLQTADGAVGTTSTATSALTSTSTTPSAADAAYGTASANQIAGSSSNTATAAVETALSSQITANASGYNSYGGSTSFTANSIPSFLNLFA